MGNGPASQAGRDRGGSDGQPARQLEQLALLTLAITLALIGFAVSALWYAAVIVLVLLWGYQAATLRGRRASGGITSAIVAAASEARAPGQDRDPASGESPHGPAGATDELSDTSEPTKQELYERAQEAGIAGRSAMSKDELRDALDS